MTDEASNRDRTPQPRAARIQVTPELFEHWLCLPPGNRIVSATERHEEYVEAGQPRALRYIEFMVVGPDMPHVAAGHLAPLITPVYRRIEHELVALDGGGG